MSDTSTSQKWYYRRLNIKRIFSSSIGSMLGIGTVAYVSSVTGVNFIMPPLGATCFIAFVIPDSAFAQPRNIVGGHILSSFIGILCLFFFGLHWWVYALAVSSAIAAMQFLRLLHPPAAANPLLMIMQEGLPLDTLLAPVIVGSITLSLVVVLFNRVIARHRYFRIMLHYIANISEETKKLRLI